MTWLNINFRKISFLLCNCLFLLSGVGLVLLGCVLLNDYPRILLSRLFVEPGMISQPLLYYVALAFISAGLIVCAVAMLGCWASCYSDSNCLMGLYMVLLIALLLIETSFVAVVALCPQVIGVAADRDQMIEGLMNNYGVPGRSQYTAAVDLAQTFLKCCGMQSGSDYDSSKWWKREQENKHDLRVPHSCCFLSNKKYDTSFLDPKPINSSLCQAKTNSKYQYGRHVKGCIDKLNAWFKDHVTVFLAIGLALIAVQLAVFLCALLVCLRKRHSTSDSQSNTNFNTSKSSKKHQRSEKNLTPKPERRTGPIKIHTIEDNEFSFGDNYSKADGFSVQKNISEPINYFSKKFNLIDDFDGTRGRDSPTSLPLVLRNDHFQQFDDHKPKQNYNSIKRNSCSVKKRANCENEEPNVYFTPRCDGERCGGTFYSQIDEYKKNKESKNYFCQNEKHGVDNYMYESCKDS